MTLILRNTNGISILIILGVLFSCQNPRQNYIRGILSSGCFWDVLDNDLNTKNVKYTYRLLPDGKCYMYRYHYLNKEKQNSISHMDEAKGEVDIKWYLKSDSVLTIDKMDYKVLKVDKSSIWLEDSSSHSFVLQKNCRTYIRD
jgi:hypothetical protein